MTIKDVSKRTGISPRKLRFWSSKGLFDNVFVDKNNIRYFSESDIEWVRWVGCLRDVGFSINEIKQYFKFCEIGNKSLEQRLKMLNDRKEKIIKDMQNLNKSIQKLDSKINLCNRLMQDNKDILNPLNKDYKNLS